MPRLIKTFTTLIILTFLSLPSLAAEDHSIDLKLFGKNVIEEYNGCRFALWQENRDPETDKFSYIFFAPFNDGEALPGWMKVGDKVYEFDRKDTPQNNGLLDKHQIYKSNEDELTLIMEIRSHSVEGDLDFISDARITLIQDDKFPFSSRKLEGHIFCPKNYGNNAAETANVQYGTLDGDAISLYGKRDHDSFKAVPAPIIRYVRKELIDCDLDNVPEYTTSYKISDAMTLWEIPCALYARNASSVYITALNNNPDFFVALTAKALPGLGENDRFDILNAKIIPETATITSFNIGVGNDCGTYESHQLRAVEGEAIELLLAEYRDKPDCDGIATEPENFPLVYSAR